MRKEGCAKIGQMSVGIEAMFTSAWDLARNWEVDKDDLDTAHRRIHFAVRCHTKALTCVECDAPAKCIHERVWRS